MEDPDEEGQHEGEHDGGVEVRHVHGSVQRAHEGVQENRSHDQQGA